MKTTARFYSSLGLLLVLNVLVKPLWIFGIDRPVQNLAGTAVYGAYFALFNLAFMLNFLLDWGLSTFLNRELAADPAAYSRKTGFFLRLKLLMLLLYGAIVFFIARASGIENQRWLWLLIGIQSLTSLFLFARAIISAHQWFRTDALFSVLDKILMILLCGGFLLFPTWGHLSIDRFLWIQLICTGIALFAALIMLWQKGIRFSITNTHEKIRPLFRTTLPYALIVLLMSAHYRLDGFLLERLHPQGAYEAGVYAGAYRLLDAANMAGYLLVSFLLPFIARHQPEKSLVNEAVLFIRHFLLLLAFGVTALALLLAPWMQSLLYHNDSPAAITVLQYCLPALIGYSLVQVYGTVLTATGHIWTLSGIVLVALLLNTGLNIYWIPTHGALGACYAALISQTACGMACMLMARHKTGLFIQWQSLFTTILIGAMLFCFLYFGQSFISNRTVLISAGIVFVFGLAVMTRLVDLRKWKQLFINH
ncbi:MAG TPA: oligosaccharide flippase family protein [Chitinophagaceae bacterium]|nr:oligosaccharide flippase family protein [Chitinophagaceae bacterium]